MKLGTNDRHKIVDICRQNNISYCAMFGSFARGDAKETSDIDLLVRFSEPVGWKFYGIAEDLEESLGRKVDLATENMLNKHIRKSVLNDLEVIYEEAE